MLEPESRGVPIAGARFTGGIMTMLEGEFFVVFAALFAAARVAIQLLVPVLTEEPRAIFERGAEMFFGVVTLFGVVAREVEELILGAAFVETLGLMMPVLACVPREMLEPLEEVEMPVLLEDPMLIGRMPWIPEVLGIEELRELLEELREEDPKLEPEEGRDEDPRDEEPRDELTDEEPLAGLIEEPREPLWA